MQMTVSVTTNFKFDEADEKVKEAARAALKDCIADIAEDAKEGSPKKTGNNMRSIQWLVGPATEGELALDDLQGAVFSTSGYGGILEIGHGIIFPVNAKVLSWIGKDGKRVFAKSVKAASPRPYVYPAAQRNFTEEKFGERMKKHLGE